MSDKYFFSACVALGTLFLLIALSPWSDRLPTGPMSAANLDHTNLVVENRNLNRFTAGDIGEVVLIQSGQDYLLGVTVPQGNLYDVPNFGPHLRLEADVQQAYAKQNLKITITARQPSNYTSDTPDKNMAFEANYAANATETSEWKRFNLTPSFAEYSFNYRPPAVGDGIGNDFLAIRPVTEDQGFNVEVKSIRFQIEP